MRKLIVKYFALNYMIKRSNNRVLSYVRASTPIIVSMCLATLLILNDVDYPILSGNDYIGLILIFASLFLGFGYFKFFPIKFEELDDLQKWQFGNYPYNDLSIQEQREWDRINRIIKNHENQYIPLLINAIFVIVTSILIF